MTILFLQLINQTIKIGVLNEQMCKYIEFSGANLGRCKDIV